ncbi:hypothetical protein [Undibacterium sp. RuRC25W]|uniref:hypothetical protein n=1 Tax=Undibacterium sp. RuRC25W TaxID=3413047 RepID=UPI003BF3CE9E
MKYTWIRWFKGVALVVVALVAAVVMWLWNWVMPALFQSVQVIDYWHALGLLVLCRILFGGFRGHGGWHGERHWQKWQKLQDMTPEEREQFFQQRRRPFGSRER